jgi:xanthosine utilization system XapX-like protein
LTYTTQPIQIFGLWGLLSLGAGFLIGVYLTIIKFLYQTDLADRPLLLLAILLIMIGIQLISLGLLAEMLARTYHETQRKPIYTVREEIESSDWANTTDDRSGLKSKKIQTLQRQA